ncbi:MAG TPA: META domain-containing protein [Flavobacteriaceae bacterium]|nr:META domain-containing protein [Flavobacteriaceae bacterium]
MRYFILFFASISLVSCGSSPAGEGLKDKNPEAKITGNFWELQSLNGEAISHPDDPRKIGFELRDDENRISGFAGCNNFFGSYNREGDKISFSQMGATRMACLQSTFDENEFLKIFEAVDRYEIKNNELKLFSGNTELGVFKTENRVATDAENKYWKLKTLRGENVVMEDDQEREIHFILNSHDNRITGFAGCNTFSGDYVIKNNSIEISRMISTMRACPHLKLQDADFTGVLTDADSFEVKNDRLLLKNGSKTIATFEVVYLD